MLTLAQTRARWVTRASAVHSLSLDRYPERTAYLCDAVEGTGVKHNAPILELGCACGRNLAALHRRGFSDLRGVEIADAPVEVLRTIHPELAAYPIIIAPAEEALPLFSTKSIAVTFSLACMMHFHPSVADEAFRHIVRITSGHIVLLEHETASNDLAFPRNYQEVFEPLGCAQVRTEMCNRDNQHMRSYRLRVLKVL